MGNLKNTIPKHIFFIIIIKKNPPSTLIRVTRKNKNPERERERERERDSTHNFFFFFVRKYMNWMGEIISNLYKIKWEEEESKYKKEKMMKKV